MVDQNTKVFVKQLLEILTGKNKYFWAADKQRWELFAQLFGASYVKLTAHSPHRWGLATKVSQLTELNVLTLRLITLKQWDTVSALSNGTCFMVWGESCDPEHQHCNLTPHSTAYVNSGSKRRLKSEFL